MYIDNILMYDMTHLNFLYVCMMTIRWMDMYCSTLLLYEMMLCYMLMYLVWMHLLSCYVDNYLDVVYETNECM